MLCCGRTDIGKKRKTNQDSFICETFENGMTLCVVCDGMGGAAGGGIASGITCGYFADKVADFAGRFPKKEALTRSDERAIKQALTNAAEIANEAVFTRSNENEDLCGMGTTLVAVLYCCGVIFTINVGDSRMYLVKDKKITQITKDHSYVQYLIDSGKLTREEAKKANNRNIITKAIGTEATVEPDIFITKIKEKSSGPEYIGVLCSDGLYNHIPEDALAQAVQPALGADTDRALGHICEDIVALANEGGGTDNITAVIFTV